MDFDLTEQQHAIKANFARFSDERIEHRAAAIDEAHAFPRDILAELAELGLFGMRYPEADGGLGLGLIEFCLAIE